MIWKNNILIILDHLIFFPYHPALRQSLYMMKSFYLCFYSHNKHRAHQIWSTKAQPALFYFWVNVSAHFKLRPEKVREASHLFELCLWSCRRGLISTMTDDNFIIFPSSFILWYVHDVPSVVLVPVIVIIGFYSIHQSSRVREGSPPPCITPGPPARCSGHHLHYLHCHGLGRPLPPVPPAEWAPRIPPASGPPYGEPCFRAALGYFTLRPLRVL